jgi:hypothetical protein
MTFVVVVESHIFIFSLDSYFFLWHIVVKSWFFSMLEELAVSIFRVKWLIDNLVLVQKVKIFLQPHGQQPTVSTKWGLGLCQLVDDGTC